MSYARNEREKKTRNAVIFIKFLTSFNLHNRYIFPIIKVMKFELCVMGFGFLYVVENEIVNAMKRTQTKIKHTVDLISC